VFPHELLEKLDNLLEGYGLLKQEFPSPRTLLNNLTKLERLISEIENRYGSIDKFLDELTKMRAKLETVLKDTNHGRRHADDS